jgi:hypothetical protein
MKELTPLHLRCTFGGCPGIYEADDKNFVIIGKELTPEQKREIGERIGEGEYAIVIRREYLKGLE